MPGIAVKSLDSAGGPHLAGNSGTFLVEGQPVVCEGDPVTPHAPFFPLHTGPHMAEGVPWFIINGKPVCREGNLADCGHASTGRSWFQING